MDDQTSSGQRITIEIDTGKSDEPLSLQVQPDGVVVVSETMRLKRGETVEHEGWKVSSGLETHQSIGPELLVLPREGGPGVQFRCPLPKSVGTSVLVGRSRRACDIVVHDDHVSRVHLKLTLTDNGFSVQDMDSKWGSQFNGRPMSEATLLRHGDELRIGTTVLRFLTQWDDAASRAPRPIDSSAMDLFETAETSPGPPTGFSGPDRGSGPPGARSGRPSGPVPGVPTRTGVPPLWLGIGIGLMIAIVGIMVWTLVTVFWPAG